MPTESVCPACGAPVVADTAFCGECDSLVSSTAVHRQDAGVPMPPPLTLPPAATPPQRELAPAPPADDPFVTGAIVRCWDCDAPNPPSRMFCAECGTFIAVGAKVFSRDSAAAPTYAAALTGPMSATSGVNGAGMMSLGSYSAVMRRHEQNGRRRALLTAVSVVLAASVGLAALYVALNPSGRHSDPDPAAALLVSSTPAPNGTAAPPTAGAASSAPVQPVDGVRTLADIGTPADVRSEDRDAATTFPEADPSVATEPLAGEAVDELAELTDGAEMLAEEPTGQEAVPAASVSTPAAGMAAESVARDQIARRDPDKPKPNDGVVRRNGWICGGEISLEDPRGRTWSVGRVSFLAGRGYERVILHMDRIGSGGSAALTAEAFPTSRVSRDVPGVRQPSAGQTTVAVHLVDGIRNNLGLRGYRPDGLQALKEFSVYQSSRGSSRTLVSSASTDGCFRVRVPAWNGSSSAGKTQLIIDIKS